MLKTCQVVTPHRFQFLKLNQALLKQTDNDQCEQEYEAMLDASTLSMTSLAGIRAALLWHKTQVEAGALDAAMEKAILLRAKLAALPNVRVVSVERASTIVSFTLEGVAATIAATRLEDAGVLVRSIPGTEYVRASVGFWNDEHDIERLVQVVHALSTS